MNDQKKIRFAVIGCGHIGLKHAVTICNNPGSELVALCDIKNMEGLPVADYHLPFFNTVDELMQSNLEFDVVSVATPNGLHEEHTLKSLRAAHHVLIEKPMALSYSGCQQIINEAVKQQRQVFCVLQNSYSPAAVWLKETVNNNL